VAVCLYGKIKKTIVGRLKWQIWQTVLLAVDRCGAAMLAEAVSWRFWRRWLAFPAWRVCCAADGENSKRKPPEALTFGGWCYHFLSCAVHLLLFSLYEIITSFPDTSTT